MKNLKNVWLVGLGMLMHASLVMTGEADDEAEKNKAVVSRQKEGNYAGVRIAYSGKQCSQDDRRMAFTFPQKTDAKRLRKESHSEPTTPVPPTTTKKTKTSRPKSCMLS